MFSGSFKRAASRLLRPTALAVSAQARPFCAKASEETAKKGVILLISNQDQAWIWSIWILCLIRVASRGAWIGNQGLLLRERWVLLGRLPFGGLV